MAIIDLSNQDIERQNIEPKLQKLKNLMKQRKLIWNKIDLEKQKKWIKSDKDPIMTLAWNTYKFLKNNFFGELIDVD